MKKLMIITSIFFVGAFAQANPSWTCKMNYEVTSINAGVGVGLGSGSIDCGGNVTPLSITQINWPGFNAGLIKEKGEIEFYGPNLDTNQLYGVIARAQAMLANSDTYKAQAVSGGVMLSTAPGIQVYFNVTETSGLGFSLSATSMSFSSLFSGDASYDGKAGICANPEFANDYWAVCK